MSSGAEKSLIKSAIELGLHYISFDVISKKEISLNNEYEVMYPLELEKIEAETIKLETEIESLKKMLESRSLEVKDEISIKIKISKKK